MAEQLRDQYMVGKVLAWMHQEGHCRRAVDVGNPRSGFVAQIARTGTLTLSGLVTVPIKLYSAIGGTAPQDGLRVMGINPGPVMTERLITLTRHRAQTQFGDPEKWQDLLKG